MYVWVVGFMFVWLCNEMVVVSRVHKSWCFKEAAVLPGQIAPSFDKTDSPNTFRLTIETVGFGKFCAGNLNH